MNQAPSPSPNPLDALRRGARRTLISVLGFSLGVNVLMLALPLYMMQVFERVLTSHSEQTLMALTIAAVMALLVMGGLESIRALLMIRVGVWMDKTLGPDLFAAGLDGGRGPRHARNLSRIRAFLTSPAAFALLDAPFVPLFLGVVFLIHPLLGLTALLAGAALLGIAWTNERISRRSLSEATDAANEARRRVAAVADNADAVTAMGMRHAVKAHWLSANDAALETQTRANNAIAALTSASRLVRLAIQVVMVALAMFLVIDHQVGLGGMIAATLILSRALAPAEQAINGWRAFNEARDAWHDIKDELVKHAPVQVLPLAMPKGKLSLNDVAWTPPGHPRPLFSDVSFTLSPGTFLALTGASGTGKSSLARLMAGIAEPEVGQVRLDGAAFGPDTRQRFGHHVGYVPQTVTFLPGTVAENIARFTDAPAEKIVLAARRAGAHEMILGLPQGYETRLGDRNDPLSAGGKQRVALARALFGDARLLVLDEPYSNLDDAGVAALMEAIKAFRAAGGTIVMTAHRPSLIAQADAVATLQDGQLHIRKKTAAPVRKVHAGGRA